MNSRSDWKQIRKQIPLRDQKNRQIAQKILPFFEHAKTNGYYAPIREEADIFSYRPENISYVLPRVLDSTTMAFYPADRLEKGAFGILEPAISEEIVPDVLVIPMLSFCDGYRLGYGGGYYDRYLQKHPQALRIGIAYDEQEGRFEPEPWDERLDLIVTPTRILRYERPQKPSENKNKPKTEKAASDQ